MVKQGGGKTRKHQSAIVPRGRGVVGMQGEVANAAAAAGSRKIKAGSPESVNGGGGGVSPGTFSPVTDLGLGGVGGVGGPVKYKCCPGKKAVCCAKSGGCCPSTHDCSPDGNAICVPKKSQLAGAGGGGGGEGEDGQAPGGSKGVDILQVPLMPSLTLFAFN